MMFASFTRECPKCNRHFRLIRTDSRKFCVECKPSRSPKGDGHGEPLPELAPIGTRPSAAGPVEVQVRRELERYERAETVEGAVALDLARRLDSGDHTGSAAAALSKALLDAKRSALEGVVQESGDALDELRRRRLAKVAGA